MDHLIGTERLGLSCLSPLAAVLTRLLPYGKQEMLGMRHRGQHDSGTGIGDAPEPIEAAIRKAVFTNLMACFRCDGCGALSIRSMSTGDIIGPDLDPAGIAALLAVSPWLRRLSASLA